MPFMPLAIVPTWFFGVLSLTMLLGGGYVIYQWWQGAAISTILLVFAAATVCCSLLGRFVVLLAHRGGRDDPNYTQSGDVERVERPDGTALHVELTGEPDAPRVILVHGWGVDNRAFFYTKRCLAAMFRVVAWDLRGLGQSSKPANGDYSIDAMADDLAAIVTMPGDRVILCGHSIGGMIIQTFARRHPQTFRESVIATVLANTTYTDPVQTTLGAPVMKVLEKPLFVPLMYLTIALAPVVWAMNWLSYLNGTMLISTALSGLSGAESRGELDFATRFAAKANPAVLARGMLAMFRFDETDSIANMPMPVLIIPGAADPVLLPSASEHMHAAMGGASLVTLARGRHMSCIERHEAFHSELLSFLDRHALPVGKAVGAAVA